MAQTDYAAQNRAQLVEYFHGGEKGLGNTSLLGVEVEHLVRVVAIRILSGSHGYRQTLPQRDIAF